jgi:hypothetical protein
MTRFEHTGKKPNWVLVDDQFCTEFGETVSDCIERYKESMNEHVDISTFTFYELTCPYIVEVFYALKEKNPIES